MNQPATDTNEPEPEELPEGIQPGLIAGDLNGAVQDADRISWNGRFYYEQAGEPAVEIEASGWTMASGKGQEPYTRTMALRNKMPLDTGFVERAGLVTIQNVTKWRGQFLPTEEQKQSIISSRVLIWLGDRCIGRLAPGQCQHFWNCSEIAEALLLEPVGESVRVKVGLFAE